MSNKTYKFDKDKLLEEFTWKKRQTFNFASEKSVSKWLKVLPLTKYDFNLNKSSFWDGGHMKYGI